MPKKVTKDPIADAVEKAVREFTTKIETIARNAAAAKFEAVMASLGSTGGTKTTKAAAEKPLIKRKAQRLRKAKRVPTAVVREAVVEALSARKTPVAMKVLTKKTGYTPTQVRRALGELIGAKTVTKTGERASSVYSLSAAGAAKPKAKKKPAKTKTVAKKKPVKKATKKGGKKATAKKTGKA